MARLPIPGQDDGTWGAVLNDFLNQSHGSGGTLKANSVGSNQLMPGSVNAAAIATDAVTAAAIQDGTITEVQLDSGVQTKLNQGGVIADGAITNSKIQNGAVSTNKLGAGVVTSNEISDETITNTDISPTAAIAQNKIANLATDLASKAAGAASSTDNAIARFDGATGKVVQDSKLVIGDSGSLSIVRDVSADEAGLYINMRSSGISSAAGFKIDMPAAGTQRAIQVGNGTDPLSWLSIEYGTGGTAKPGISLGNGAVSRDVTLYRDSADVLKTDDNFVVGSPGNTAGSVVTVNGSQSLTNKTLTQPTIQGSRTTTLTDGATINTDASQGNVFPVTLAGNRTIANPTNPTGSHKIMYRLKQDATGGRTVNWGGAFRFGTDIPTPTLSTAPNKTDYIGFIYNATDGVWDCIAVSRGY